MSGFLFMYESIVIGIAGPVLSGKSTIAYSLSEILKIPHYENSDILGDVLVELNLPVTREGMKKVARGLFKSLGVEIIALSRYEEALLGQSMIVSGIRYPEELDVYRRLNNFFLVYLDATIDIRRYRLNVMAKGKDTDITSLESLNSSKEELYLSDIKEKSNLIVTNNESLESAVLEIKQHLSMNGLC